MRTRKWLSASIATVVVASAASVVSFGLFSGTAGAATTPVVTVTSNASTTVTGGTLTFTVTVGLGDTPTPTGTVNWTGTNPSGGAISCAPSTLDAGGTGTCTIGNAVAGTYSATANYLGDTNYTSATGSDTTATVGKAASTTTVTDNAAGVLTGGSFLFTATVTGPPSAPTPTGTVTWSVSGPTIVTCAASTLNAGVGTSAVSGARAGTYTATASYGGDANYLLGTGSDTTATVGKAASTTTVADSASGVVTGGTFTFTATVSGPGVTPTGTVTWSALSGPTSFTCASSALNGSGVATCTVTAVKAGTYSATVAYAGDVNYSASSGSDVNATVGKATPTAPNITNLPAQGTFGGNFIATVSGSNGDGALSVTSNSPTVCTATGLTVSYVGAGTCSVTAQIAAGTNYLAASGTAQTFTIARAQASTPTITNLPTGAVEFAGFTANIGTTGDGTASVVSSTTGVCQVESDGQTVLFITTGACTLTSSVATGANWLGATGSPQTFQIGPAPRGYWLVGSDGGIFSFGAAAFHGSMGGVALQRPVVGITPTLTRGGYWLVASDGGLFSFGDAGFYGSIPGVGLHPAGSGLAHSLAAPIVGMVPSVNRRGYFMVASDGGVFAFGDAKFEGSCPGIGSCSGRAVAVMPDHTGNGYWLVTSTGGVYSFGDAPFYGAPGTQASPVVNAAATPDGMGYWLLYADGVVANYGDASNFGAPTGYVNAYNPANAIFPTADGKGYWVASTRGDVFAYGNSPWLGSMAGTSLNGEIIAGFGF